MSRRYPKNRKKQGGARRALLVFLLTVLILAALAVEVMAEGLGKLFPILVAR